MRKLAANYIYPVSKQPVKNGIIVLNDENVIIDLIDPGESFHEIAGLEYFNGILTPGFISTNRSIIDIYNGQKDNKNVKIQYRDRDLINFREILKDIKRLTTEENMCFYEALKWATLYTAELLKINTYVGSLDKGKSPGVNLISPFNFKNSTLDAHSDVSILV